jgi:hypothetical protein
MMPTPRATDGTKGSRTKEGAARELVRGRNIDLGVVVQMYPTPNATDGSKAPKFHKSGNPSLPCLVEMSEGSRNATREKVESGSLNPEFVEYLMGFPIGFTDLEGLETP